MNALNALNWSKTAKIACFTILQVLLSVKNATMDIILMDLHVNHALLNLIYVQAAI